MTRTISPSDIAEMRAWLADCTWSDDDADAEIRKATDYAICRAIQRFYAGGMTAFLETIDA